MPWGQHKGIPIEQVPADYLGWCLRRMDACNPDHDRYWPEFKELLEKLHGPVDRPPAPPVPVLCRQLAGSGVKLAVLQGQIQISGQVTPEQEWAIREHRQTIVAVLACAEAPAPVRSGSMRLIWGSELRNLIKSWFLRLSRQYHPDVGGTNEAQTIANQAYKSLMTDLDTWEKNGGHP
jgi:hypothetical protein